MVEQGQMVSIRHRHYLVEDVSPFQSDSDQREFHKVNLECLDDDMLGNLFQVIWEHEPHPKVHDAIGFPKPESWDTYDRFRAFLYALEWTTSSHIEGPEISAPFRAAIELDDYQLEPVVRALMMPRVNLLIADDVGLGKTIEAGLVAQELLSRQMIRRILIVCPASLQRQWKEEMESKFQLTFEIIDSAAIQRLRKEYGIHVNPWSSFPRLITSLDFVKREQPLSLFRQSLQTGQSSLILKDWDLLIIDEAHNVAPAGRKTYVKDSDRTKAVREIVEHCEHRLFLTATPHNGYTESFTALLELLDPLRFSRGPEVKKEHVKTVMVRRLKDDIEDALGRKRFTTRKVIPLDVGELKEDEKRIYEYFEEYKGSRLNKVRGSELFPIKFTFTLLKKRLLSSPLAFARSIETHINNLTKQKGEEIQGDLSLVKRLHASSLDDWDNDDEKAQREEDVIQESSKFFTYLTDRERWLLEQLQLLAQKRESQPDEKMNALLSWIDEKLRPEGKWNNERLLIFTEYKDTLEYIENVFLKKGWKDRIIKLYGGMGGGEREEVKAAFQSSPEENSIRILIATDAASEGLNLQNY
jgi:SNF2 family DNA or RNA helicase